MADGKFLGDRSTHGKAQQMDALKAQSIHQSENVICHVGKFVAAGACRCASAHCQT
jgi:hypothetical protein